MTRFLSLKMASKESLIMDKSIQHWSEELKWSPMFTEKDLSAILTPPKNAGKHAAINTFDAFLQLLGTGDREIIDQFTGVYLNGLAKRANLLVNQGNYQRGPSHLNLKNQYIPETMLRCEGYILVYSSEGNVPYFASDFSLPRLGVPEEFYPLTQKTPFLQALFLARSLYLMNQYTENKQANPAQADDLAFSLIRRWKVPYEALIGTPLAEKLLDNAWKHPHGFSTEYDPLTDFHAQRIITLSEGEIAPTAAATLTTNPYHTKSQNMHRFYTSAEFKAKGTDIFGSLYTPKIKEN